MERATPPSWAEGDPGVLAEQFVNITKDTLSDYRTKYYALVAAIAAASIHNVLTKSPAGSRQQHVENIKATAAAVVQRYRTSARRGGNPDAARAQPTPAALQKLDSLAEQVLQQLQQQQQPEPQLITAAFEVGCLSSHACSTLLPPDPKQILHKSDLCTGNAPMGCPCTIEPRQCTCRQHIVLPVATVLCLLAG